MAHSIKTFNRNISTQLRKRLQSNKPFSTIERRLYIKYLEATDMFSVEEYVALFNEDPRVIIADLKSIREERNQSIGAIQPVDYISEYIENQKYAINKIRNEIENGRFNSSKDKVGCLEKYSQALSRLTESLQSLGALPKELGNLSIIEEKWIATVGSDGEVLLENENKKALTCGSDEFPEIVITKDELDGEYMEG